MIPTHRFEGAYEGGICIFRLPSQEPIKTSMSRRWSQGGVDHCDRRDRPRIRSPKLRLVQIAIALNVYDPTSIEIWDPSLVVFEPLPDRRIPIFFVFEWIMI